MYYMLGSSDEVLAIESIEPLAGAYPGGNLYLVEYLADKLGESS